MKLPLDGLRILAVEQYGAGPYGSTYLADMGAEVIKLEHRASGGDMSRGVGPYFLGADDSHFFQSLNRNKKSLTLDLKHPRGREVLEKLVVTADGVFGNLRGDQPEKLRLRYADLAAINPRIVCAHLSAYGNDGSRKGWPGYDFLVQAECGFLSLTGEPGGPPARIGLSMVDFMTGLATAFALMCGLHAARATGIGRDVEVSLFDIALHQLSYPAAWYLNEGLVTTRMPRSAHPYLVPSQLYRTRDGWIFFMCQTQRFWELLCAEDRPPGADPRPRLSRPGGAPRPPRPADRGAGRGALRRGPRPNGSRCWAARCPARRSTTSSRRSTIRSSPSVRACRSSTIPTIRASSWWRARSGWGRRCRPGRRRSSASKPASCSRARLRGGRDRAPRRAGVV